MSVLSPFNYRLKTKGTRTGFWSQQWGVRARKHDARLSGATLMGAFKKVLSKPLFICLSALLRWGEVRASALIFLPLVPSSRQICV